ncbi:MAG: CoA transferase [Rhodospirillales bacterium]|nr:CoA transferase [Rhodospirillales bacterium]
MTQNKGPLDGIKVVTCSTAQAGTVPYSLMADLGAEVIKIEIPGIGDGSRTQSILPGLPSTFFETNNRGVKSLTLNLKDKRALAILHKLVAEADIFGQNFRPGAAEKNGFGYEDLRRINPKLVYASISGYGPDGPNAALPGTDAMGQALGGIAEAYATPGQPLRTGIVSVADETCAYLTFGGVLAALLSAQKTGVGQKVETSLLGGQVRLMGWTLTTIMWRDQNPVTGQVRIAGTADRPSISVNFADKHGKPFVFQLGGKDWQRAMTALGFYEELQAVGLADLGVVVTSEEMRTTMLSTLDGCFARGDRDHWVGILRQTDIVTAPVNTMLEASNDPDVLANGYIAEVDYPEYGKTVKVHGSPWKFSETPAQIGKAPKLGEDTDALLAGLGYSDAEIAKFHDDGLV